MNNTWRNFWWGGLGLTLMLIGCSLPSTFRANNDENLPKRYKVEGQHVVIHSDVKLGSNHPLLLELKELRLQIAQTLELPLGEKQVQIYLFEDEVSYHKFLTEHYPGLPPRRAYFVGTSTELSVYTVWSDRIQEDMRHEFTHGVLHGALPYVPLWLDEGLAEYFERPMAPGTPREDYLNDLSRLQKNGWRPNLRRLEYLDAVGEMQKLDYAESWAWVHWLLHNNSQTRQSLLDYLRYPELTYSQPLSQRLLSSHPQAEQALSHWIEASQ